MTQNTFNGMVLGFVIWAVGGCALKCPDGSLIGEGTYPGSVQGRYGTPDITSWTFLDGTAHYDLPGRPGLSRCGNEPGTLTYFYLMRREAFVFDRDYLTTVRPLDESERCSLEAQIAQLQTADTGPSTK